MKHKNYYVQWVYPLAKEYVKKFLEENEGTEIYIENNAFFVTMTFDNYLIKRRKTEKNVTADFDTSVQLTIFKTWYLEACKKLLGANYHRAAKRNFQPFCFVFFDVKNSKYKKTFDKKDVAGIHIHALMILPRQHTSTFEKWANSYLTKLMLHCFLEADAIEVKPFDENKGTVKNAIAYAAKFASKSAKTDTGIVSEMIYPEHLHNHRPETHHWKKRNYNGEKLRRIAIEYMRNKKYNFFKAREQA